MRRGRAREGDYSPLVRGFGGSLENFFEFLAFLMGFYALGPDFSRFGHKDISTECWTKLFSDSHVFFYFFVFSMFL